MTASWLALHPSGSDIQASFLANYRAKGCKTNGISDYFRRRRKRIQHSSDIYNVAIPEYSSTSALLWPRQCSTENWVDQDFQTVYPSVHIHFDMKYWEYWYTQYNSTTLPLTLTYSKQSYFCNDCHFVLLFISSFSPLLQIF